MANDLSDQIDTIAAAVAKALAQQQAAADQASTTKAADRLIRIDEVVVLTGMGKTSIYRLMKQDRFPQQFKPGGYASRWSEREVLAWRDEQRGNT